MAALDDIVGCVVFFITIAAVASSLSAGTLPAYMIVLVIVLPRLIGIAMGFLAGFVLKKERSKQATLALLLGLIAATSAVGFVFNNLVLPSPILNFMLIGMAFSATFANMLPETRLEQIMENFSPVLGVAMIVVILNLGAPLDYHLILGAGLFTVIYILARAAGKYFGAYFGASITRSPETVKKYLGLTLLPHSGVSLVFTGIAVSVLSGPAPDCAKIVQGTIAVATVSETGKVTAKAEGSATITVCTSGGDVSASYALTVKKVTCSYCGASGHTSSGCPQKAADQAAASAAQAAAQAAAQQQASQAEQNAPGEPAPATDDGGASGGGDGGVTGGISHPEADIPGVIIPGDGNGDVTQGGGYIFY